MTKIFSAFLLLLSPGLGLWWSSLVSLLNHYHTFLFYKFGTLLLLQLEDFLQNHPSRLPLPGASGEETIFEYLVDEKGQWQHWQTKVCIINLQLCGFQSCNTQQGN